MQNNQDKFKEAYRRNLRQCVVNFPDEYFWPVEQVDIVADRMFKAIDAGTFNHDSKAFKYVCKELGIKWTRKAILDYWKGN